MSIATKRPHYFYIYTNTYIHTYIHICNSWKFSYTDKKGLLIEIICSDGDSYRIICFILFLVFFYFYNKKVFRLYFTYKFYLFTQIFVSKAKISDISRSMIYYSSYRIYVYHDKGDLQRITVPMLMLEKVFKKPNQNWWRIQWNMIPEITAFHICTSIHNDSFFQHPVYGLVSGPKVC